MRAQLREGRRVVHEGRRVLGPHLVEEGRRLAQGHDLWCFVLGVGSHETSALGRHKLTPAPLSTWPQRARDASTTYDWLCDWKALEPARVPQLVRGQPARDRQWGEIGEAEEQVTRRADIL